MTTTARDLLAAFDTLTPEEQQQVAAEIYRRTPPTGELPDAAFEELAAELLRGYDAEEGAGASS